ncbi:MAG: winged helix-turn-helix domain-containing protein [Firmicutes bacterium]|nr:winged helix-turn-helix domain-containing protein [Bacillota bacterium]
MKTGNLADLQDHNLSRILELLRENEGISRQDLVEMTGLSASGVSKLVGALIDKGLVVEDTVISRNKGRRAISLKLNPNSVHAVGVRLARHYVQCGLFNVYGQALFTTAREFQTRLLAEV